MKVSKRITIYIFIGILIIITSLIIYLFSPWVVAPTKSSTKTLTLTSLGHPSPKSITLKHYIGDAHKCDYVLELKYGLYDQTTQHYELPKLTEGSVEVEVELSDYSSDIILVQKYNNVHEIYKNGLLIYFGSEYVNDDKHDYPSDDEIVCYISGDDRSAYIKKAYTSEWLYEETPPVLKKLERKDDIAYVPSWGYEWKTNKWVEKSIGDVHFWDNNYT